MVSSVTGPITEINISPDGKQRTVKSRYRQRSPYTLPLPYGYQRSVVTRAYGKFSTTSWSSVSSSWKTDLRDDAANKALARIDKALTPDRAELAVTIAEMNKAVDMIAFRSSQILRMVISLKNGHYRQFRDSLRDVGVRGKVTHRKRLKHWSKTFLEYHYGWSPLVKDIGAAVNTLQKGIPPHALRARGAGSSRSVDKMQTSVVTQYSMETLEHRVQLGGQVAIQNSDLWLANQLGFINPASVAWELVPFSFVVDWFVNVGEFLNQATGFLGLSLQNTYQTHVLNSSVSFDRVDYPGRPDEERSGYAGTDVLVSRSLGWPSVKLRLRPFQGWSCKRAAAAVSLLLSKGLS